MNNLKKLLNASPWLRFELAASDNTRPAMADRVAALVDVRRDLYKRGSTISDQTEPYHQPNIMADASPGDVWLDSKMFAKYDESFCTKTVCHELAHAYLNHVYPLGDAAKAFAIERECEDWLFWHGVCDRCGNLLPE